MSFQVEIQKVTITLKASNTETLKTRSVNPDEEDIMIFSPKEPLQHHQPNRQNPDQLMFFIEANNFFLLISFREYYIDMQFKLRSFRVTDRSLTLHNLNESNRTRFDAAIDEN